jgi:hypothetical protein
MNRLSIIPGSHTGTSGLILLTDDKRIEMSVKSSASQVITPTEKRIREIAFDRTAFGKIKKKTNPKIGLQV